MKQQNTDRDNSCAKFTASTYSCLEHLHLELSFIVLLLLPFLIIVIVVGGLVDHAKEVGVTNVEVVACIELIPPILETRAHFIVHDGPIQAHALGLPSHI